MEKNVSAVVVTYNRIELLKECLAALDGQSYELSHILVVNNNSSDGTTEWLKSLDDKKYLIHSLEENIGGAAGFSYGVEKAYLETEDDIFWIMDDDTIPDKDALLKLTEATDTLGDKYGFLCSNIKWIDGAATNIPDTTKTWSEKVEKGLIQVERATFVSICVSRESVRKFGLPTAELVIWGDDTEYTTRLSSKEDSYMVSDSIATHKAYKNLMDVSLINDTKDRIDRYYYMYRNVLLTHRLYHNKKAVTKQFLSNCFVLFRVLIKAPNAKMKRMKTLLSGTIAGLAFNPNIKFPKESDHI